MLISKLALPDTVAGYLGLGKYSLTPAVESSRSAPSDAALDQPAPPGAEPAPAHLAASSTSTKAASDIQGSRAEREQEGEEARNVIEAMGTVGKPEVHCGSSAQVAIQTQEIRALQDITYQVSTALGITHEWISDFCEQLIDEWERDTECGDVSDA